MWTCAQCGESHDEQFKECWKCAGMRAAPPVPTVTCTQCHVEMIFAGERYLQTGPRSMIVPEALGQMRQSVAVYTCQQCGKVEFLISDETHHPTG